MPVKNSQLGEKRLKLSREAGKIGPPEVLETRTYRVQKERGERSNDRRARKRISLRNSVLCRLHPRCAASLAVHHDVMQALTQHTKITSYFPRQGLHNGLCESKRLDQKIIKKICAENMRNHCCRLSDRFQLTGTNCFLPSGARFHPPDSSQFLTQPLRPATGCR